MEKGQAKPITSLRKVKVEARVGGPLRTASDQQETHLWLFLAPSFSRRASASGHGWMRCTGPLAMSAVVLPSRLTALTSAPFETRYWIISTSPRAAALCSAVLPSWSVALTPTPTSSTRDLPAASIPDGAKRCELAANPSP